MDGKDGCIGGGASSLKHTCFATFQHAIKLYQGLFQIVHIIIHDKRVV